MKKLMFVWFLLFALLTACSSASSPAPERYDSEVTLKSEDVVNNDRVRYAYQQDFYTNQILNVETL